MENSNRIIKFRAWDKKDKKMIYDIGITNTGACQVWRDIGGGSVILGDEGKGQPEIMQYTGLQDKNGKEIYELMEVNNKYRVIYLGSRYVLQDISSGDIVDLYEQNKLEITGEYSPV